MILFIIAGFGLGIENTNITLICLILWEMAFNMFNGTCFWLYVAEITVDKALGIAILFRMGTLYIFSIIAIPIINAITLKWYLYIWGGF